MAVKTYSVFHHYQNSCSIEAKKLTAEEAFAKVSELNEAEEKGSGHYHTTDLPIVDRKGHLRLPSGAIVALDSIDIGSYDEAIVAEFDSLPHLALNNGTIIEDGR